MNKNIMILFLSVFLLIYGKYTYAVDADFSIAVLNTDPIYPNSITLSNVNVSGVVGSGTFKWNTNTNGFDLADAELSSCFLKAPVGTPDKPEQQHENSYGNAKIVSPPDGYKSIIGWISVVNNGSQFGRVKVRSLNVYAVDTQTKRRELAESRWLCWDETNTDNCYKAMGGAGFMLDRTDWTYQERWTLKEKYLSQYSYGSSQGMADPIDNANENDNDTSHKIIELEGDKTVVFNTSKYPTKVFHAWNTCDTTVEAYQNKQYQVEAEVLVEGEGMIQIGYDFLSERKSAGRTNKQGAISFWECSSTANNWVKIRAGLPPVINYAD